MNEVNKMGYFSNYDALKKENTIEREDGVAKTILEAFPNKEYDDLCKLSDQQLQNLYRRALKKKKEVAEQYKLFNQNKELDDESSTLGRL